MSDVCYGSMTTAGALYNHNQGDAACRNVGNGCMEE